MKRIQDNQIRGKQPLIVYASYSPVTRIWVFDISDKFGHFLTGDFGRAPREIIADHMDGIALALMHAHRRITERFPNSYVASCLTELRDCEGARRAA